MGFRRFTDRDGREWEIRDQSRMQWQFEPIGDNTDRRRAVAAPSYERDAFELSQEELQQLLDRSVPERERRARSPFRD